VMSYGFRDTVSAITLAAMEDLGWYVGNYSGAGCMLWGREQGCTFVTTRCGNGTDDSSAATATADDCQGDAFWGVQVDAYLAEKCGRGLSPWRGLSPCDSLEKNGFIYSAASGERFCNAQCHTPIEGRDDCGVGPAGGVEAASSKDASYVEENWKTFLWLGVWVAGVFFASAFLRAFACPSTGSVAITSLLSVVLGLIGACAAGAAGYGFFFAFEFVSSFAGKPSLYILAAIGGVLVALMLVTLVALCCKSRCLVLLVFLWYILLILLEAAVVVVALYWGYLVTSVTNDTVQTLRGSDGDGKWDGQFGEEVLQEIEGMMCRTYQLCCSDLAADGGGSCLSVHEGQTVDVAVVMADPGSDNFCAYVSGSSQTVKPAEGTCDVLEWAISGFSVSSCQENLCTFGIDGYEQFVRQVVDFMHDNAIIFGAVGAFVVLFQAVLAANLWTLRRVWAKDSRAVSPDMATTTIRVKSLRRNWTRSARSMDNYSGPV